MNKISTKTREERKTFLKKVIHPKMLVELSKEGQH
jgi:hypothetical protein